MNKHTYAIDRTSSQWAVSERISEKRNNTEKNHCEKNREFSRKEKKEEEKNQINCRNKKLNWIVLIEKKKCPTTTTTTILDLHTSEKWRKKKKKKRRIEPSKHTQNINKSNDECEKKTTAASELSGFVGDLIGNQIANNRRHPWKMHYLSVINIGI